jgi:hypothetical protein
MVRRLLTRRRIVYTLAALATAYVLLGFVGVPLAMHYLVLPRVNEQLHGQASLANARFNPFTLRLTLHGIDVHDVHDDRLIAVEQFVVDLRWSSIWRRGVILDEFSLTRPFAHIGINESGEFRLLSLLKLDEPSEAPREPGEAIRLAIARLAVIEGTVLVTDDSLPQPFRHELGPMDLLMEGFDTIPDSRNPHHFVATSATGERLEWEGWFHLNPLSSEGRLTLSGITTEQYDPYAQRVANFRVKSGRITVGAAYRIDLTQRPVVVDGSLTSYHIEDAQLTPLDSDEPFLRVGRLMIEGAKWNLVERSAHVERVDLHDGTVRVHRLADGTLNWQTYFKDAGRGEVTTGGGKPAAAAVDPNDPWAALMLAVSGAAGPWQVVIGGVGVEGQTILWRDDVPPRTVEATLLAERIEIGEVRSDDGFRLPLKAALRVNDAPVTLEGEVMPMPAAVNLAVEIDGLALGPFDPYVEQHAVKARFRDGRLYVKGDLTAAIADDAPPRITYRGDARIDDFNLTELQVEDESILRWRSFTLAELAFDSEPLAIRIGSILLDGPAAAYLVGEDGEPAIASLLVRDGEAEDVAADVVDDAPPRPLPIQSIGRITVTDGGLNYLDKSQQPHVSLRVSQIEAKVSSLSLEPDSLADIDVKARLQNVATAVVAGRINPLLGQKYLDMRVALDLMPMATFDPFSRRYIGHTIDRGTLTFEFPLRIDDRRLEGEIRLTLDKFYLGQRVPSEEAINAPVGLALNLLRDPRDIIRVNVPIRGDLDDPKFRVGHLVVQAILNTMTNLVASPFKLLAGALGAGDADLSAVDFEPGRASLTTAATQTLNLLATAMRERPALKLQLTGNADRSADIVALRKARLMRAIREALAQRLRRDDPLRTNPEAIPVPDEDYRLIVAERYQLLQSGELTAEDGAMEVVLPRSDRGVTRRMTGGRMQSGPVRTASPRRSPTPPPDAVPVTADGEPVEGVVTFAQMEKAVLDAIAVSAEELADLATQRSAAVHEHLTTTGMVDPDRLTIAPPPESDDARRRARVEFTLQ